MKKSDKELLCINSRKEVKDDEILYILVTDFDDSSFKRFYDSFMKMLANPDTKMIPIVIHTFGGHAHCLLAMIDLIKASKKPVITVCIGKAMSCGIWLLAAGTKGYRFAAPSADLMLHEVSSGTYGKNTDIKNDAEHTKFLNDSLMKALASWCGKKERYFLDLLKNSMNVDLYMSSTQAKKHGIVDQVGLPDLIKI